jgi:hypothetical protein
VVKGGRRKSFLSPVGWSVRRTRQKKVMRVTRVMKEKGEMMAMREARKKRVSAP